LLPFAGIIGDLNFDGIFALMAGNYFIDQKIDWMKTACPPKKAEAFASA
jgi:hypothetical protein